MVLATAAASMPLANAAFPVSLDAAAVSVTYSAVSTAAAAVLPAQVQGRSANARSSRRLDEAAALHLATATANY